MARYRGLRVRLTAIRGLTPKGILERPLYLPAVLNEYSRERTANFTDFQTHAAGEFSIPMLGGASARSLDELDLEFLTLDWQAPWLVEWRRPEDVQAEIGAVLDARRPVLMLVMMELGHDRPQEFRDKVTLRRTRETLKPGEADTRYWEVDWKVWRPLSGARLSTRGTSLPTRARLKADTTFGGLSRLYYKMTLGWRQIARTNAVTRWGPDEPIVNLPKFKVGDYVKIPRLGAIADNNTAFIPEDGSATPIVVIPGRP